MAAIKRLPVALTIAGSDSGGGAGIQADLKTFAALGVHGTSAITCITAQNPERVTGIQPVKAAMVQAQIEAVFAELSPAALKTGMLFSAEIIKAVAGSLSKPEARLQRLKLVVDPVMVATSGASLLKPSAVRALTDRLFPLATVITPNLDEVGAMLGRKPRSAAEMRSAAEALWCRYGCAVLVKGGHLRGSREALDIFFDGRDGLLLTAPFVRGLHLHGTGCAYSAAITSYLALGLTLPDAVTRAKGFITKAIVAHYQAAGHVVLNTGSGSASLEKPR